ncbi:MAG: aminoglycoside N(3)-acetyltransferase [Planctomycetaceae bacterium]|nr:MAG: aminoglycoside N(3)-acetyltransferase [Planctomycetaceae bacterium]
MNVEIKNSPVAADGRTCWTAETLTEQLISFGVARGDLLMVHSAIRGCGRIEGGAEAIVHALVDAIGPAGTVVFPTFTGVRENHPDTPPVFDRRQTPCWTGALPETARKLPGGVRSFHPTHSCVAFGGDAADITADHYNSVTPIDSHSPIYKVAQRGGKILIIGLDLKCLTLAHHVEELLKHPDPCFAQPCLCLMIDGSHREQKEYYLHDWDVKAVDYELFRPFLEKRSAVKPIQFGDSAGWLLDAAKTLDAITEAYKQWVVRAT